MKKPFLLIVMAIIGYTALCQAPVIISFSPISGPVGSQVTITGNNFSAVAANNIVSFGAVRATVTAASTTSLTVKVPLGATFEPLSVAVNNLTAYTHIPFKVTYNNGGGEFIATSFDSVLHIPGWVSGAAADMDGDHKIDLIYANYDLSGIEVCRNMTAGGAITFASPEYFGGVVNPLFLKVADLNGDGLPDVLTTSPGQNAINIYKNVSTPGFIAFNSPIIMTTGADPGKMATGDIDGDGRPEIVCANRASHTASVFKNTSAGGNLSFDAKTDFAVSTIPSGIAIGDFDGDLKPDIATAGGGGYLSILVNTSTGTISFAPHSDILTGSLTDLVAGDLDGDGKLDLVTSNSSGVSVLRNNTDAALSFESGIGLITHFPNGLALNDLNADGKTEIIVTNSYSDNGVSVAKNNSDPELLSFASFTKYTVDTGASTVVAADFDNDGLADLASFSLQKNSIIILKNKMPINTQMPQCPALLSPANGTTNISSAVPLLLKWQKEPNATSYRLRIFIPSGAYTQVNTTDTFYLYTPASGVNYTWDVTPVNMADPTISCPGFSFSTCPSVANSVTISALGGTSICGSDSVKLVASSGTNVQWFLDNQLIAGATGDVLQAKAGGSYTVRVLNSGCYSDASNVIPVTILPTPVKPTLTKQNDTAFCPGGSVTLSSTFNINNQWYNGSSPINGANGTSYVATTSGNYYLRCTNSGSGCYRNSDTVIVQVIAAPAAPTISIAAGTTTFCSGDSVRLQSTAGSSYQWYNSIGAITGATNQQYVAKSSGTYSVKVTNGAGCTSVASTGTVVTSNPVPPRPTITSTGTTFCNGDSLKLHSSATTGNQWYRNNVLITNATAQDYYAKDTNNYTLKVTAAGCVSDVSNTITTSVKPLPAKPVVTSNGTSVSITGTFASYQWYFNNAIIASATAAQYNTTQNGLYKVEVTDFNGCKNISDNFNYITTGVNDVFLPGYSIQLYPNPVIDELTLKVAQGITANGNVTVNITDAMGRPVKTQSLRSGINTISLKHLSAGSYWVLLKNGRSEKAVRILKL